MPIFFRLCLGQILSPSKSSPNGAHMEPYRIELESNRIVFRAKLCPFFFPAFLTRVFKVPPRPSRPPSSWTPELRIIWDFQCKTYHIWGKVMPIFSRHSLLVFLKCPPARVALRAPGPPNSGSHGISNVKHHIWGKMMPIFSGIPYSCF